MFMNYYFKINIILRIYFCRDVEFKYYIIIILDMYLYQEIVNNSLIIK